MEKQTERKEELVPKKDFDPKKFDQPEPTREAQPSVPERDLDAPEEDEDGKVKPSTDNPEPWM